MQPLTVPGTLDSLSAIADYVKSAAAAGGLDKKVAYKLRLAVDEIATNIIIHGYQEAGSQGLIDLQADINEQAVTLYIEDTGEGFDPFQKLSVEEELVHLPIEQRPLGRLGVYLAIQGVDKFLYERVGKRNRNIFVVNRQQLTA
jgi:anti-sigma regulatory factor (Ser/Thr protein kinase)